MNRLFVILSLLIVLGLVYTCGQDTYQPSHLHYLSPEEKLLSVEEEYPTSPYVVFRDSVGNELSPELRDKLDRGQLYLEPYVNQEGEIAEVIVREMQPKFELWSSLERLARRRDQDYETIKLNCADRRKLLRMIYKRHKADLADTSKQASIEQASLRYDQNTVLTILEHCGFPTKEEVGTEGLIGIFYGLTHSNGAWLARYYPLFKQRVEAGQMPKEFLARIQDWALVFNNRPQIYGTQYTYNYRTEAYELGRIRDSLQVDERRTTVGLGPLAAQKSNKNKPPLNILAPPPPPPSLFPPEDSLIWQRLRHNFDSIEGRFTVDGLR